MGFSLRRRLARAAALSIAGACLAASTATAATPPGPPASGPGSEASLPWSATVRTDHTFTDATKDYTTFEPSGWRGAGAAPTTAPLVVFLHGYLGYDPKHYATWLDHIVRQGNVVVFPAYQAHALTPPRTFTANAIWSLRHALPWLAANARVTPDIAQGMVLVGHSYGGVVSANMAARAAAEGLPRPRALFLGMPWKDTIDASLAGIPASTKLLCLVGEDDTLAGRTGCDLVWDRTSHLAAGNRNYVLLRSDAYGAPPLDAWHRVPSDADEHGFDALDWYGFWKLADALRSCALSGADCRYALGNTWEQTFMGRWSDGRLVNPLWVYPSKPASPFPDASPPAPPAGAARVHDPGATPCRGLSRKLVGMGVGAAKRRAIDGGCLFRVVVRDGVELPVTDDHLHLRINVRVADGVVRKVVGLF